LSTCGAAGGEHEEQQKQWSTHSVPSGICEYDTDNCQSGQDDARDKRGVQDSSRLCENSVAPPVGAISMRPGTM